MITRNRRLVAPCCGPWAPLFIHGDLQVDHNYVDGDEVTGVLDWSEASHGDALFDLAILTLGHPDHLSDVVAGYGTDVDRDLIRAWWSMRWLTNVRWLTEVGEYGPPEAFPEVGSSGSTRTCCALCHRGRPRRRRPATRRAESGPPHRPPATTIYDRRRQSSERQAAYTVVALSPAADHLAPGGLLAEPVVGGSSMTSAP